MTRIAAMTFLVVLVGSWGPVEGENLRAQSAAESEIRALNDQVAQMQVRHDVATASRLLGDEYIFSQADGQVTNKAENLAVIGSADFVCTSLTTSNVDVRVYGETAVVVGQLSMKATFKGEDVGGNFRYTDIWVRRQGQWQNVASHASLLPKPGQRPNR